MSSPFLGAEPVTFEKQMKQEEQPKEEQKPQIPGELKPIMTFYEKVVENPENIENLWNFVQSYLTFLESKTNMILPILKEHNPEIKSDNLMIALQEGSMTNIPWGVYNAFVTLSSIGSGISQKQNQDNRDKFYIIYVMLSFGEDSPVYNFTELLRNIQENEIYKHLNEKFLKAFEKYNNGGFLEKMVDVPIVKQQVKMKWLMLIVLIFIILLLAGVGSFYWMDKTPKVSLSSSGYISEGSIMSD